MCVRVVSQVVTGVGKHSAGGQPRILPAVKQTLRQMGAGFWHQANNPGVIEVLIPPGNKLCVQPLGAA